MRKQHYCYTKWTLHRRALVYNNRLIINLHLIIITWLPGTASALFYKICTSLFVLNNEVLATSPAMHIEHISRMLQVTLQESIVIKVKVNFHAAIVKS